MTTYKLEIALDQNDLARRASQIIATYIDLALDQRERAQIALSGGSTPAATYKLLGQEHLPWDRVDVFLGDERWVDLSDGLSNSSMIRKTLLTGSQGSGAKFHTVPLTELTGPADSAKELARLVEKTCVGSPPVFDLILLGLGEDGHTASLFPGSDALNENDKWATESYGNGMSRITLTAPVLSSARKVVFLVSGAGKQQALKRLLDPKETFNRTPACLVKPRSEVLVLSDKAAAGVTSD